MAIHELQALVRKLLKIKSEMKVIDATKAPLEELETQLKQTLLNEMIRLGKDEFVDDEGVAKLVTKNTSGGFDTELLMKDLGVDNLKKYELPAKQSKYIMVKTNK